MERVVSEPLLAHGRAGLQTPLDPVALRSAFVPDPRGAAAVAPGSLRTGAVSIHGEEELQGMRRAGRAVWRVLAAGVCAARHGARTLDIDRTVAAAMESIGAEPLFRGYRQGASPPFPSAVCVSVNDEVVHGVPGPRVLRAGDVVSIDVGLRLDGWCADAATTIVLDLEPDESCAPAGEQRRARDRELIACTRRAVALAAELMVPGVRWSTIARRLESLAIENGLGMVAEYVGHGIGRALHEPPKVPAYWTGFVGHDFELRAGMVLAVEPILTAPVASEVDPLLRGAGPGHTPGETGRTPVRLASDGWTVMTRDGSIACHEERMIAVTPRGGEILTV